MDVASFVFICRFIFCDQGKIEKQFAVVLELCNDGIQTLDGSVFNISHNFTAFFNFVVDFKIFNSEGGIVVS